MKVFVIGGNRIHRFFHRQGTHGCGTSDVRPYSFGWRAPSHLPPWLRYIEVIQLPGGHAATAKAVASR
jgi:hypothetical protein